MNRKTRMVKEEDGSIKIVEEEVEEPKPTEGGRQTAVSYYKRDSKGNSEKVEAYFNVSTPQRVKVTVTCKGDVHLSTHLYCASGSGGPDFPICKSGESDLYPGYWRMYFLGWIGAPAEIRAVVYYS